MKCPVCKKDALFVGVHDDEGNYYGLVGCDYESNPWSGLSYALHHDGWGECPLCTDGVYSTMGGMLFDTAEEAIATLTPQNEWVSVETPPTEQGWYHVAILDLKTGKYNVEQDLYSIELAKKHGFEPGFCKEIRWEERERIDYWCRFPSPPESRPPEGEE